MDKYERVFAIALAVILALIAFTVLYRGLVAVAGGGA